ncbi:MAG: type IV pilin protein, partial [Romboutsia sp.]|uniref:type IV pilin protein n=1 Tax=Romboutsia sp. TaxID=1965302 RepID=UPI003F2FB190
MLKFKCNNKGFTLVELLVVVAIIGILAIVAVPNLFKSISKSKVSELEADYNAFKSATLSHYSENNELLFSTPVSKDYLDEYIESVPLSTPFKGEYHLVPYQLFNSGQN